MSVELLDFEGHKLTSDLDRHLLLYQYNGAFLLPQAQALMRASNAILDKHPGLYAICDTSNMKSVPPETRKLLIDWFKEQRFPAIVCFGSNLATRTVATLITSAARILGGKMPKYVFVSSESEAYAWVANQVRTNQSNQSR